MEKPDNSATITVLKKLAALKVIAEKHNRYYADTIKKIIEKFDEDQQLAILNEVIEFERSYITGATINPVNDNPCPISLQKIYVDKIANATESNIKELLIYIIDYFPFSIKKSPLLLQELRKHSAILREIQSESK